MWGGVGRYEALDVAEAVQREPGSPGEGDQRVLNKYQKNQGAQGVPLPPPRPREPNGAEDSSLSVLRGGTSVRRGAVQPLWRPATGRVLRLWRTERYRLKGIFMLY